MAQITPLQKHTLNLFHGDFEKLAILFPEAGASLIIRTVVHRFIERIENGTEKPENINVDI